jgi:hypothetical protein
VLYHVFCSVYLERVDFPYRCYEFYTKTAENNDTLGQKHRKVALFLGQFCGQTPVAEQVVALEHLRVVLSVHQEVLPLLHQI